MVARKKGRFILLASMQGKHGTKDASSYSASKWGILGLMKSAAMEFGEHNITVNALMPGLVDTALTRYEKRLSESMGEQGQRSSIRRRSKPGITARRPCPEDRLAATGRHFPRRRFPRFRRGQDGHRRGIRGDRRRQRERYLRKNI